MKFLINSIATLTISDSIAGFV